MKQWLTKAIAFLFVFALGAQLFLLPPQAQAQAPRDTNCDVTILPDDPQYAELCTTTAGGGGITADAIRNAIDSPTPNLANTTAYVFYTISILLTGTFDPTYDPSSGQTSSDITYRTPETLDVALGRDGVIGGVAFLTAEMYRKQPASAGIYFADLFQNSRLTGTPAYAQGIGFGALNPILGTWKAFRDVAYYLLTVMFLVTGFLILIRHKISGNVAVTVQNALPKLVITLILITFSYAIAGLIVDLMFLVIYFVINIFSGQIFTGEPFTFFFNTRPKSLTDLAFNTHIFEFTIGYVFNTGDASAWGAASAVGEIVYDALTGLLPSELSGLFGEGTILKSLFGTLISVMFTIIFGIALLIAMFRTFFSLVMSYAGFVINVVLSPFILLGGAIPGKDPWKNWIKNLIGGLAPFVVVVFMIFMSLALTGSNTRDGIGYNPDALDNQAGLRLPLIMGGNIDAGSFIGVLAMGFMLLMPEAVKMTKKMVGASGGVFDEFKDAAVGNLKKGWSGQGPIPGAPSALKGAAALTAAGGLGATAGAAFGASQAGKRLANQPEFIRRGGQLAGGALGVLGGGFLGAGALPTAKGYEYLNKQSQALRTKIGQIDSSSGKLVRQGLTQQTAKTQAQDKATPRVQPPAQNRPQRGI